VRDRTGIALKTLIVAVALFAAGCCQKSKCGGPPAEIAVRDQAGMLPPGTTVESGGVVVTEQRCRAKDQCAFPVARVGTATVSAPGYKPVQVPIELKLDDCDNMLTQQIEVVLVPETSAEPSVTHVGQALGCS
jgi:hypothetical protein